MTPKIWLCCTAQVCYMHKLVSVGFNLLGSLKPNGYFFTRGMVTAGLTLKVGTTDSWIHSIWAIFIPLLVYFRSKPNEALVNVLVTWARNFDRDPASSRGHLHRVGARLSAVKISPYKFAQVGLSVAHQHAPGEPCAVFECEASSFKKKECETSSPCKQNPSVRPPSHEGPLAAA
jgi:hypothetical protein